ncbi:hypothetical protein PENTCL1PPCAC_21431 [Pristionchus entomophagus]|uniref:glucuronosyltransferase n=1 Tax=Pristionchus entomophagus TaxID=358040 RepID=A0AAV5TXQ7_9BILA|nr:hypothetical protein PENTCL1PPCAC_21431 [Pristionchus entomophagus]
MKCSIVSLLFIFSLPNHTSAYKILVYNSKFGHSNVNFYGSIADILVDAGHDVTSLMTEIDPSCTNGTVKSKVILVPQTAAAKKIINILHSAEVNWFEMDALDPLQLLSDRPYADQFVHQCAGVLKETALLERLNNEKFDVMIAENFDMCGIGLVPLIRPKALINGAASAPLPFMNSEFGLPLSLSTNPSVANSHLDVHSFLSRLKNIYAEALGYNFFVPSRTLVQQLFREKFGPDYPSLTEISSRAAYTIINSEPLLEFATPILNRIVYVGGLGAREPKPLDQDLDEILSFRPRTVLISFGSIVAAHELDDNIKLSILETVSRFPDVTFIWKYERPDDHFALKAKSEAPNLHLIRWIPQNDLLADRRLNSFVTHAGMGSTQELALRGKPGLFIPIFGDQMRNAGMMERSGVGKVFDKRDLGDSTKLTAAIKDLLENQSYRMNAERLAAMIAKKPFSAQEQLVKVVEFVAEFGPSPALRPQSYDMNWIEYSNFDIIIVSIALSTLFVFATVKLIFWIFRKLISTKEKQD